MISDCQSVAGGVFCSVLEKMAFMFGEPTDKEELDPPSEAGWVSMNFSGPFAGTVEMVVPEALGLQMAANLLGMEPDDEAVVHSANDAVKEVLNITVGNILTVVAGSEPVFDLSVPEFKKIDEEFWRSMSDDSATAGFLVEDEPVLLRLSVKETVS